jgi:EmrB/QacA subfamily drug resistance transporter
LEPFKVIKCGKSRKWWGLLAIMPSLAMVFVDQSVLPVALPTIQKDIAATNIQLQWCINAYLLVTAVFVLAGGKIGDWMGHRKAFTLGMLIFSIASALCGATSDVFWLIAARGLQGVGAALMFPASTALLMSLFPPSERGKATGINVSASSLFLILGPLVGGYLTQTLSWRWIFWINLPLAALGLFLVFLFIPRSDVAKPKFDIQGFIYFVIGCSSLVVILMQGREWGWTSVETIIYFALFVLSTILLLRREKTAPHPFLDLSLFKHPIFKAVNISVFAIQFILMITVFRAIFFQSALDWSPMKTGVVTMLSSSPVLFLSPLGGMMSDKFGPKLPIAAGFLLLIFSFIWTAFFVHGSLAILFLGLVAFGCGVPLVFTPSYASAMGAVPQAKIGSAFGTIATIRTLAGTLGVAMLGAFIDLIQLRSLKTLALGNPKTSSTSSSVLQNIAAGAQQAKESLSALSSGQSEILLHYYRDAEFTGFFFTHLALAGMLIIAFIFVFILHHRKSKHELPAGPAEGWD